MLKFGRRHLFSNLAEGSSHPSGSQAWSLEVIIIVAAYYPASRRVEFVVSGGFPNISPTEGTLSRGLAGSIPF